MSNVDDPKQAVLQQFGRALNSYDVAAGRKVVTEDFVWSYYEGPDAPDGRSAAFRFSPWMVELSHVSQYAKARQVLDTARAFSEDRSLNWYRGSDSNRHFLAETRF